MLELHAVDDINGDGYAALAPGVARSGAPGEVQLFYGGARLRAGERVPAHSIIAAGDVNADGYADLLVRKNPVARARGFEVGLRLNTVNGLGRTATALGNSINGAVLPGDFDGDGFFDDIVGARR